MSRGKGNRAAAWVADYLRPWWPHAEARPSSRAGTDITGTPGVAWEVKTGIEWRAAWLAQALGYAGPGEIAVVCYLPPGTGCRSVHEALAIMPMAQVMGLLADAGYAPLPDTEDIP